MERGVKKRATGRFSLQLLCGTTFGLIWCITSPDSVQSTAPGSALCKKLDMAVDSLILYDYVYKLCSSLYCRVILLMLLTVSTLAPQLYVIFL